jgi:hypothetical protein
MLFNWLVTGQVMRPKTAHAARGPGDSVGKGSNAGDPHLLLIGAAMARCRSSSLQFAGLTYSAIMRCRATMSGEFCAAASWMPTLKHLQVATLFAAQELPTI